MKLKSLPRPMPEPTAPRAVVVAKVPRPVLELLTTTAPHAVVVAVFQALLPRPVQTLKAINHTGVRFTASFKGC